MQITLKWIYVWFGDHTQRVISELNVDIMLHFKYCNVSFLRRSNPFMVSSI